MRFFCIFLPLATLLLLPFLASPAGATKNMNENLPAACDNIRTVEDAQVCSNQLALHIMNIAMTGRTYLNTLPPPTQDIINNGVEDILTNSPENCNMLLPDLNGVFTSAPAHSRLTYDIIEMIVPVYDRAETCSNKLISFLEYNKARELSRKALLIKHVVVEGKARIRNSL